MTLIYDDKTLNTFDGDIQYRNPKYFGSCVTGCKKVYADDEKVIKAYKKAKIDVYPLKDLNKKPKQTKETKDK